MRVPVSDSSDHIQQRLVISDIKLRFVENGKDGLLAWASCVVNGAIFLNNIAVRRGRDGGLLLTYPAKRTAAGAKYHIFHPINADANAQVEEAIVGALAKLATESPAGPIKDAN